MAQMERNGHHAGAPSAPLPAYHPIHEQTRCPYCHQGLMNPDGSLQNAEWREDGDGWCHTKCLQQSNRLKKAAEGIGSIFIPDPSYTREDWAAEVQNRFRNF